MGIWDEFLAAPEEDGGQQAGAKDPTERRQKMQEELAAMPQEELEELQAKISGVVETVRAEMAKGAEVIKGVVSRYMATVEGVEAPEPVKSLLPYIFLVLVFDEEASGEDIAAVVAEGFDADGRMVPGSRWQHVIEQAQEAAGGNPPIEAELMGMIRQQIQRTPFPSRRSNPSNKLANVIVKAEVGIIGGGEMELEIRKATRSVPAVTTMVNLYYQGDAPCEFTSAGRLTLYDREIINAITAISQDLRYTWMTTGMIYRALSGQKDVVAPKKQAKEIEQAIKRLCTLWCEIRATEEASAYGWKGKASWERTMLQMDMYTLDEGREPLVCWKLHSLPLLYEYAKISGQIQTFPSEELVIHRVNPSGQLEDKTMVNTADRVAIKSYLLYVIHALRHQEASGKSRGGTKARMSNTVLCSTLFDAVQELTPRKKRTRGDRAKEDRVIEYALCCLENWKQKGLIRDYRTNLENAKKPTAIKLFMPKTR